VPSPGATYDAVTRQTALAAAAAAAELCARGASGAPPPFVFVSAAEAAWTFEAPVEFLRLYLDAKRAVERELLDGYGASGTLRPVVLRPSLVWTPRRPAALPAVAAFWAANALGVPFVDRPVSVDTLAAAAVAALSDASVSGIKGFREMEALAGA
jgi:nucleoside-diphosphate-sugar epimerase